MYLHNEVAGRPATQSHWTAKVEDALVYLTWPMSLGTSYDRSTCVFTTDQEQQAANLNMKTVLA